MKIVLQQPKPFVFNFFSYLHIFRSPNRLRWERLKFTSNTLGLARYLALVFFLSLFDVAIGQTLYSPSGALGTSSNSYVGIGTSSPTNLLSVVGDGFTQRITHTTTSSYSGLTFYESGTAQGFLAILGSTSSAAGGPNAMQVWNYSNAPIVFGTNGVERARIDSNGNLGIGTTIPSASLHISKSGVATTADMVRISGAYDGSNLGAALTIKAVYHSGYGSDYNFTVGQWQGGYVDVNLLNLNSNGNVGIGTTSPAYKLSVNGAIRAKEVIIDTGWSDYVFDKDYRLAPLNEVELHIKKNGHLPGIPSSAEVKEKGISLGEMQSKLLAKIEELTLHQIALEKENHELRDRMSAIERR